MADLYAITDWHTVRQPQLAICALDTPAVHFPWLSERERVALTDRIVRYVRETFQPWERSGCDRFARSAPNGTLVIVPESNHYVFLVSAAQTYHAIREWLAASR